MNINWRLKSMAFHWIDVFSLYRLLSFLQKHVTRRSNVHISEIAGEWSTHQINLAILKKPIVLEFGAGRHLAQNIYLSQFFGLQTVVDLFAMLDLDQVNEAALQFSQLCSNIEFKRMADIADIERNYGVRYLAPLDVRSAPFQDNSFDACISTYTLEHIPEEDIITIFKELRRVISPQGLISAVIDYSDHYSHTDREIGDLNYLQYSAEEFRRFNHKVHYQNRLRHYSYCNIFDALKFKVLRSDAYDFAQPPAKLSPEFERENPTLCATRGIFLLQVEK